MQHRLMYASQGEVKITFSSLVATLLETQAARIKAIQI